MKFLIIISFVFFTLTLYGQDCEKANNLFNNGDYEVAIPLLKSCLNRDKTNNRVNTSLLIAGSYFEIDMCDSALHWCNIVLKLDESNLGALKMRVGCYIEQKEHHKALIDIEQLIYVYDQKNSLMYFYKGYLNYKLLELESALESVEKSLELNKNDLRSNQLKGSILYDLERYEEAVPYIKASLSNGKELGSKHKQIGICYYYTDSADSAIFHLNKSLNDLNTSDNTFNEEISFYLGMSYNEKGDHKNAIKHLEQIVDNDKYFIEFHPHLAYSYVQVGSPDKAIEVFSRSRKFFPDTPEVFGKIGTIYLEYKKDTLKAREYFLKALNASDPPQDSIDFFIKISSKLIITKDVENALKASDILIENYPEEPIVYKYRVLLLEEIDMSGYFDEIMSIFKTLQDLYLKKGEKEKASYYLASRSIALMNKGDFKRSHELINEAIDYREYPEYFAVRAQVKLFMLEKEVRSESSESIDIKKCKQKILADLEKAMEANERKEAIYKTKFISMMVLNSIGAATEEEVCRVIVEANLKEKVIPQDLELYFCDGIIPEDETTGEYHYIFELSTFYDYFGEEEGY